MGDSASAHPQLHALSVVSRPHFPVTLCSGADTFPGLAGAVSPLPVLRLATFSVGCHRTQLLVDSGMGLTALGAMACPTELKKPPDSNTQPPTVLQRLGPQIAFRLGVMSVPVLVGDPFAVSGFSRVGWHSLLQGLPPRGLLGSLKSDHSKSTKQVLQPN